MPRAAPGQTSFCGGELSPLLEGRPDLEKYGIGCRRLRNFFPLVQGPARLRGGSRFINEIKDSTARTWLSSFLFSATDALVIEWGHLYNRFYRQRGAVNVVGAAAWSNAVTYALNDFVTRTGVQYRSLQAANINKDPASEPTWWVAQDAYEIASVYTSANLINDEGCFGLSLAQSADVTYLAHYSVGPKTLSRTSNVSWAYADYQPEDGPFDPQNIDKTISITVSAATGTVTLTNDSAYVPVPLGTTSRLIRVEETDKSAVKPWEANKRIAAEGENPVGEFRRSDGHLYTCATNATVGVGEIEFRTGSVKPVHTEGTEGDGDGEALYSGSTLFAKRVGVDWTYLHSGYGVGRITAVAGGGLTATLVINTDFRFPASIVSAGSYRWSLGAWYTGNFPSCVAFYRDRLVWAGKQRVWASVAADYSSMAPDEFGEVLPDSAIDVQISIGSMDQVNWLVPQPNALLVGTGGTALAFEEITRNLVLGPANVKFEQENSYGFRKVQPLNVAEFTLAIQVGGRFLLEMQYSADQERVVCVDLTAFAEHMSRSGFIQVAFAQNPHRLLWCLRNDGKLACLTYNRAEAVIAWSLHDVGGVVESIAVIPGVDSGVDDLYMIVRRTINGSTKRYVEVLLQPYDAPDDPWLACYQDCSLTYDGKQAVTLTPGAGATVQGTTGVTFTAGSAVFSSGDVGRFIAKRTYDTDAETWSTAVAEITGYTSTTVVTCTIVAAFPSLTVIVANGWRLSAVTITGLAHLNGELCRVTANGGTHLDRTPSGGAISLTRPGFVVHVGKAMKGVLQLMNLEAGAGDGTAQGKIKKISTVTVRLLDSMGGQFGPNLSRLTPFQYRRPENLMNEALPLFSGDQSEPWNNGYETEGRITIVADDGLPMTVCAIYPQVNTEDNRTGSHYRT